MRSRILVTGIPGHYTRLVRSAKGATVHYGEQQLQPESKEAFLRELTNISNTGNYLIGEGALRAMPSNATQVPFWHLHNACTNGTGLDEINANFDICVFTCANLLRKGLSADAEALVLKNLDMPIVMLGIGIQNRADLEEGLPEGTQRLLDVLKGKEHYFLTRGHETAEFLKSRGFSFVRPTGCPSVYFLPDNMRTALKRLPEVKVGSGRTVFSGYLGATEEAVRDVNMLSKPESESFYVVQDEFLHFDMKVEPNKDGRVFDSTSGQMIGDLQYKAQDQLQRKLKLHTFFDTNQWRAWTSSMDFSIGRRFHGNIIALQSGVPGLMVAVDDRMREMLRFTGLPSVEASALEAANDRAEFVADHLADLNVPQVVETYNERESNFRATLRDIGLN